MSEDFFVVVYSLNFSRVGGISGPYLMLTVSSLTGSKLHVYRHFRLRTLFM